jgi:hypothetical protein
MKTITAVVGVAVVVALATGARISHESTPTSHVTTPASTTTRGDIAVSSDDDSMSFTATCQDNGALIKVTPNTPATRPAATRECGNAAHDYAVLNRVAASGG